jgi:hypothetical protein
VGHVRDPKDAEHETQARGHDKEDRGPAQTDQNLLQQCGQGDVSGKFHSYNAIYFWPF